MEIEVGRMFLALKVSQAFLPTVSCLPKMSMLGTDSSDPIPLTVTL
jgi:hypothetical protein